MDARNRPAGEKRILSIGTALVVVVLAVTATVIRRDGADGRRDLDQRFHTRAELTASFTDDFVTDLADRERQQAERLLAGPTVDQASFDQVVQSFGFDAAVLLDGDGRLLRAYPASPAMEGTDMTLRYEHLRTAVGGDVGVSRVVPSAVEGIPITAVAAPYTSSVGPRVLSGAFSPERTPLRAYFSSIVPVAGGNAFLFDDTGALLAAGGGDVDAAGSLTSVRQDVVEIDVDGVGYTAASEPVQGAPWRVVLAAPTARLHAPVKGGGWLAWGLWAALGALGLAVQQLLLRLNRARALAADQARIDHLTGLPNRRGFLEQLELVGRQSKRAVDGAAVLLVDVDHFKQVNDRWSHAAGDAALRAVASALRSTLRDGDLVGRWGGEEFIAVLFPTVTSSAAEVAERIRAAIAATELPFGPPGTCCTASIGVATIADGEVDAAMRAADGALYEAKEAGRDRVVVVT